MRQKGEITLLILLFSAMFSAAVASVVVDYKTQTCHTKDKVHCEVKHA